MYYFGLRFANDSPVTTNFTVKEFGAQIVIGATVVNFLPKYEGMDTWKILDVVYDYNLLLPVINMDLLHQPNEEREAIMKICEPFMTNVSELNTYLTDKSKAAMTSVISDAVSKSLFSGQAPSVDEMRESMAKEGQFLKDLLP